MIKLWGLLNILLWFNWQEALFDSDTWLDGDEANSGQGGLVLLYEKIRKIICGLPKDKKNHVTVMIDDMSLIEVAANGASDYVLDFLHYCHTLTSEFVR